MGMRKIGQRGDSEYARSQSALLTLVGKTFMGAAPSSMKLTLQLMKTNLGAEEETLTGAPPFSTEPAL